MLEMIGNFMTFVFEATDTAAHLAAISLYFMAKHKDI